MLRIVFGGKTYHCQVQCERRSGRWMTDAAPIAASGSTSPRVFLDKNRNGVMDAEDCPVAGAGFVVNGATHMGRTGSDGVVWPGRLLPNQYADIALDAATLEDPQWHAAVAGVRIVPRAGSVAEFVGITREIDGTIRLLEHGAQQGAGDLELELVDAAQAVVAHTTSSADGYFVMAAGAPGGINCASRRRSWRLDLNATARAARVGDEGNLVSDQDVVLTRILSTHEGINTDFHKLAH